MMTRILEWKELEKWHSPEQYYGLLVVTESPFICSRNTAPLESELGAFHKTSP